MRFTTDRSYRFPLPPDELWSVVARVDDYQSWWPWLRGFDADQLAAREVWRCHVQPPLPYSVRFAVSLDEVDAPTTVRASITGDVVGDARLHIAAHPDGSEARLVSCLEPGNGFLKVVARLAGPVVRYGHDWVLDSGARQFSTRAV